MSGNAQDKAERSVKLMVTGDSMTHGQEGDHTWRYRLWDWLRDTQVEGAPVRFVGPFHGTMQPDEPCPPQPPRFKHEPEPQQDPRVSGRYAKDCNPAWVYDSYHFALWGRQAAQVRPEIEAQVAQYKPDYLLVALGFNDLGWFLSDGDGLLDTMKGLLENARRAKHDIKVILSTVPSRSLLQGRQDLIDKTTTYNTLIREAAQKWSRADSPVTLAEFHDCYSCGPEGCPAGYDGLHPNALGEYEIAKAFSEALVDIGFRQEPLRIPKHIHDPTPPVPENIVALSSPTGVKVTWDPAFGARAYEVRTRVQGHEHWDGPSGIQMPRLDITFTAAGVVWEVQVRSSRGDGGAMKSSWSGTVSAKSTHRAAPGPKNICVTPLDGGVQLAWLEPEGTWDVDRYEVVMLDTDIPGAFITCHAASSGLFIHGDLQQDHRYDVWVATWATIDGETARGIPAGANSFYPRYGRPSPPRHFACVRTSHNKIEVRWQASDRAAAYVVYRRAAGSSGPLQQYGDVLKETSRDIEQREDGDDFEYCISAVNGNLESEQTYLARPTWQTG